MIKCFEIENMVGRKVILLNNQIYFNNFPYNFFCGVDHGPSWPYRPSATVNVFFPFFEGKLKVNVIKLNIFCQVSFF